MENAITVKDVTKIYKLYDKPIDRLKEALNPFHKEYHKKFYALNNLSFEVKKGGGQWRDLCSSGAGRRFQYGLYRN